MCDRLDPGESSASRVKEATYSQPLSVILLVGSEESGQGVVAGNDETSKVGQKLAAQVEDDEEKVESANADGGVGLGDARRLLEVVKGGVLGELSGQNRQHPSARAICLCRHRCRDPNETYLAVELTEVLLSLVLSRHCDFLAVKLIAVTLSDAERLKKALEGLESRECGVVCS